MISKRFCWIRHELGPEAALANRIAAFFKDPAAQRTAGAPADAAGSVAGAA